MATPHAVLTHVHEQIAADLVVGRPAHRRPGRVRAGLLIGATTALTLARNELGSADSWSAYDTWFGGGLISSSIKHDRIDDAGRRIAQAQEALVDLARELGEVQDVAGLRADLGISPTTRTFDVWFDNLFSDLSVRSSIQDSSLRVDRAIAAVHEANRRMTVRGAALDQQLAELRARRDALLAG